MASNSILHGSDLPAKQKTLRIKVVKARRAPEDWKTKFILDIEPVLGERNSWPLNKTNVGILKSEFGGLQKAEGKTLELTITENEGGFPPSLTITGVVASNGKVRSVKAPVDDEDAPF
jgi:hypothetical protein